MPDKLIEWKSASLRSGVSSFGFSGTNGHGIMEATASTEPKELRKPAKFARKARLCGSALSRFFFRCTRASEVLCLWFPDSWE